MPFSMLGQSSKAATASVVRTSLTSRANSKICMHGFQSGSPIGVAQNVQKWDTISKRGSFKASPPEFLYLELHRSMHSRSNQLCSKDANGRTMLVTGTTLPTCGPSYLTKRARSTIAELFRGNEEYMENMSKENPGLLSSLANEGQRPPFMLVDCSDSRVNEQGIFSAQPGTIFTAGNIANRFDEDDLNSNAVLSFAVETLKVKHVVVLGHYGCGGVAAAMMPLTSKPRRPADIAVQGWISPIRHIYETSTRDEIVAHRGKSKISPPSTQPHLHDPAFRALVEENVKSNVHKIANSAVVRELFAAADKASASSLSSPPPASSSIQGANSLQEAAPIPEIYIHGWVYDVENGKVSDLNVSVGPAGRELPFSPFPVIPASIECSSAKHALAY